MIIRLDDLRGVEIATLLQEHLRGMRALSPPESVHALDIDALRQPDITFWRACQVLFYRQICSQPSKNGNE